jgi:hypothetical protein
MENKPENPMAFPYSGEYGHPASCGGMTLRDYFAAKAMQSYLSAQYFIGKDGEKECSDINICNEAYRIADTMLKQREL